MTIQRVGIVGLGLIGGSIAAAARGAGLNVRAFDVNPHHLDIAARRELVDSTCDSLAALVGGVDVIVIATPVGTILDVLSHLERLDTGDALILDTGSVKVPVVRAMECLAASSRAVGGHPIAGRETAGPESSGTEIVRGRSFVLTPSGATNEAAMRRAEHFVRLLGMEPVMMEPERHDSVLARTSHLPQLLSTVLALTAEPDDLPLAGPGYRDMTRLARGEAGLWSDIFAANDANVAAAVTRFLERLQRIMSAIEGDDRTTLMQMIEDGRRTADVVQAGYAG